jgi:hypothetical protein
MEERISFKSSNVYKILSCKERNYNTLVDLNKELNENKEIILLEDNDIGSYLHYLTQTAKVHDE